MKSKVKMDSVGRILIPKQIQNLMDIGSDVDLILDYNEKDNTITVIKDNDENIVYENFCLLEKQINDISKNMNDEDKKLLFENIRKTKELLGYPDIHCY